MKNYILFTIASLFICLIITFICKTNGISTLIGDTKWLDYLCLTTLINFFFCIFLMFKKIFEL